MPLNQREAYLLFGREPDLITLLSLPDYERITAVIARAKMGKTKTLTELGHRLQEGGCLVGYYESVGTEHSVLLHALQDAYRSWFSTKSTREEIISVFSNSKEPIAKRIYAVAKPMLEKLEILDMSGAGKAVSNAIGSLLQANEGLTKGPLQLPTLDYDLAQDVASLLYSITGKKIILILDGWEKFKNGFDVELNVLSKIIENKNDWPPFHIYLGIRKPEVDEEKNSLNRAPQLYSNFVRKHNSEATDYTLPPMHLDESTERAKLRNHLETKVPQVSEFSDEELFSILDGYPGCLDIWLAEGYREEIKTIEDLKRLSDEANNYSYPHLKFLFDEISNDDQLDFLVRLALLPQLNDELWVEQNTVLLDGMPETTLDDLENKYILEQHEGTYPSYGHDTQHVAVRNHVLNNHSRRCDANGSKLVKMMAKQVTGFNNASISSVILLLESANSFSKKVKLDDTAYHLLLLVTSLIEPKTNLFIDSTNSELTDYVPLLAMAYNNRGVRKGQTGDNAGEIADYTAVIDMDDAPAEQRAKAFYNRGVDRGQTGDNAGEIADYTAVIDMDDAPAEHRAQAFYNRGFRKGQTGDNAGAIADYTAVIDMDDAPAEQRAKAYNNRGVRKGQTGDNAGEIADYTAVIDMDDAPAEQRAKAFYNRGVDRGQTGDNAGEIADYTAVIDMDDAPAEHRAQAFYNRGVDRGQTGDNAGAIADYTAVIDMDDAPAEHRAKAFYNRGVDRGQTGDNAGEIADYTAVIDMDDAPADIVNHVRNIIDGLKKP